MNQLQVANVIMMRFGEWREEKKNIIGQSLDCSTFAG